jgi:dienelactone hydrolase
VSLVQWPISRIGTIGSTMGSAATQVRLYGLLLEPAGAPRPAVIAISDANESAADAKLVWDLAGQGFVVFAPFFTERRTFSNPWLEDRQWLVRLAYQTGRHVIGSEALRQVDQSLTYVERPADQADRCQEEQRCSATDARFSQRRRSEIRNLAAGVAAHEDHASGDA